MNWFVLITFLLTANKISQSAPWLPPCPQECWCHEEPIGAIGDELIDTPAQSVATDEEPKNRPSNEMSFTQPSRFDQGLLRLLSESLGALKTVICVQQRGTDIDTLIGQLPPQTQALKILQATDAPRTDLTWLHFRSFGDLRALSLEGARDENWTLSIRSDTLKSCQSLQYLSLVRIQIVGQSSQEIQVEDVDFVDRAVHQQYGILNLTFETGQALEVVEILPYEKYKEQRDRQETGDHLWEGFLSMTKLEILHIFHCQLPDSFSNDPVFTGLTNLKELIIEASHLKMPPKFAKEDANNLQKLILTDNHILEIRDQDFQYLLKLRFLDLSRNNITHVTENSFPYLPALDTVELKDNPLEAIYPFALTGLNSTRRLSFNNKPASSDGKGGKLTIFPDSFHGLFRLEVLTVDSVELHVDGNSPGLNPDYLSDLRSLTEIHFSGNLVSIEADTFARCPKLRILDLKHCQLQRLSVDAFQNLDKLRVLDLSDNKIEMLFPGLFDPLNALKELWLNQNQLTSIPPNLLANLPVKMIRLENNPWHCDCSLNELKASLVNKNKVTDPSSRVTFLYDKKVTPVCASPASLKDLVVFDALRKELKCHQRLGVGQDKKKSRNRSLLDSNWSRDKETFDPNKKWHFVLPPSSIDWDRETLLEHGPEIDQFKEEDDQDVGTAPGHVGEPPADHDDLPDYIDHGPEIIEELDPPVKLSDDLAAQDGFLQDLLKDTNNVLPETNVRPQEMDLKASVYSPTLSKKSLKLLMEEEKMKDKLTDFNSWARKMKIFNSY